MKPKDIEMNFKMSHYPIAICIDRGNTFRDNFAP